MTENELREQVCEIGRLLHRENFVAATDGNISVRLSGGRVLVTPTCIGKGFMKPGDLVLVNLQGNVLGSETSGAPTSELGMHLFIYRARPDVGAVVHAHPPTATGYAAAGRALDQALVTEIIASIGCVPLAPFAIPGSPELAGSIKDLITNHDAILLANHGVVTCGPDLMQAYFNMERVEHFARITLVAELLGKAAGRAEIENLLSARGVNAAKPRPRPPGRTETAENQDKTKTA